MDSACYAINRHLALIKIKRSRLERSRASDNASLSRARRLINSSRRRCFFALLENMLMVSTVALQPCVCFIN